AYHHTLLLVDVSGVEAADDALARAVGSFVETVQKTQSVSVFAFDGSPNLRFVADFPKSPDGASADVHALAKMGSSDVSRNLNGALTSGLKELDARLAREHRAVKVGTLVVFTRGPDLAGRVSEVDAEKAIDETQDNVLALGIAEQAGAVLDRIGKSGAVHAQNADALGVGFEQAAMKTRDLYDKYYLIAYCSPARSGSRRLKIEIDYRDKQGSEKHGAFDQDFDATGFGPGCNVQSVPRFVPQVAAKSVSPSNKSNSGDSKPDATDASNKAAPTPPPEDDNSVAPPPNNSTYSH
ncbi:MAG TPA: hypothetical protein VHV51_05895, partial [Polyangiaceae bacterium]|nr:hypothetical protein [Polyangiaceae bacterium]